MSKRDFSSYFEMLQHHAGNICKYCKHYNFLQGGCKHECGERDPNAGCMNGKFDRANAEFFEHGPGAESYFIIAGSDNKVGAPHFELHGVDVITEEEMEILQALINKINERTENAT